MGLITLPIGFFLIYRAQLSSMLPPIIQEVVQAAKYKKHFDR